MPQWEYKVIHLNVDSGKGGEPSKDQNVQPPFTKSYLEQEFPQHYNLPQPEEGGGAAPPPPLHPAKQLQNFLNGHGAQGWNLVGIFPLGSLLMMVMRRRSSAELQAEKIPKEPGAGNSQQPDQQELIERLEALERRLTSSATATPIDEGTVLDTTALETLAAEPSVSAREAAAALGYRSTASLSNFGSRAGYPIGLTKLGVNGKVAVYRGSSPSSSGGKAQRHWVVLMPNRLER